jgi:hypothetical protein
MPLRSTTPAGDDALYSTVLVAALFNFYNRLVDGVGLDLPDGYIPEAAKRLSTKGYDVFAQMAQTSRLIHLTSKLATFR